MLQLKKHINIALLYFLMVGAMGVLLRLFYVTPVLVNYRYIVHAHSHVALLGWVYLAISTIIYRMYFSEKVVDKAYQKIFLLTNMSILGMMFSFPFQGYALFSIIFSTLFLIASYLLAWFFLKKVPSNFKKSCSYWCVKAALCYMVLSSLGPWAVGGIMGTLGKSSIWYKLAIYFYLHFQYNGWFILALIGVLFFIAERVKIDIPKQKFFRFFWLINAGIVFSFFLSVLWLKPPAIFYWLAALGAMLQVAAFFEFFYIIKKIWKYLQDQLTVISALLLKISAGCLSIKILLQLFSALPFFAELSFKYTDFVIGYLHWTFLGVISLALFGFLNHFNFIKINRGQFWLYVTGFILSEGLIFYKGVFLWMRWGLLNNYFEILVGISALIPVSIGIILFQNLKRKATGDNEK
ncbi:hypothetical protein [Zunongwangia pacifica]|uniref:Uncharacterized protein n=1 Tax=Zunongwangia pacifica TaxID=2911062 RepID=A0A9X1ZQ75_9FLAO|nr:hypothetical protein [Zunongwangia pacifica]MCL6218967.1 hypothetical protein [Zunongwangia pacifica]